MVNKITVVGAGTSARRPRSVAEKELARTVVMVDVVEGIPQGKGLDQWQSAPIEAIDLATRWNERLRGNGRLDPSSSPPASRASRACRVMICSTRTPASSSVVSSRLQTSPNAILIIVSNPLDVMCYVAKEVTGFPRERVSWLARSARWHAIAAFSPKPRRLRRDIQAMVLGGHGDTMVP
jgi:malate dehydrogenase